MKNMNFKKIAILIMPIFLVSGCGLEGESPEPKLQDPIYDEKDVRDFLQSDLFKQNNHYFLKVCLGSLENGYYEYFSSKSGRLLSPVFSDKRIYGDPKLKLISCDLSQPQNYKNQKDLIRFIPKTN